MEQTQVIKVKSVRLYRAEGDPYSEVRTVESFADADTILHWWARTAPRDGSYHKCDYTVTYEDGHIEAGRIDLTRGHIAGEIVARELRRSLCFYAGLFCPDHLTKLQYGRLLEEAEAHTPGRREESATTLGRYQVNT